MPVTLQYHSDCSPESRWHIFSATEAARSSLMFLQEAGEFFAGPHFFTERAGLDSFLIMLTLDGRGLLEYDGRKHRLLPGRFFWIDCAKPQHYRTDPAAKSWHMLWVHFSGANARTCYDAFLHITGGAPTAAVPPNTALHGIFREILGLNPADPNRTAADFRATALLTRLSAECVLAAMDGGESRNAPETVRAVAQHLLEHYREKHTLESLGARFDINPFYLQKLFKRHMGLSPTEYHTFLRMTRAKELMRSTRKSIGEIALEIGMDNLGYFSRLFRQQEGMTPHEYRRLWPALPPEAD